MTSLRLWKVRWSLQVFVLSAFLCFSEIRCISLVNPLLKQGIAGVWDKSKLVPSMFRDNSARKEFHAWPEDLEGTNYFCEDGTGVYSLENFTYSPYETILDPRPYYDAGFADEYLQIFKYWNFWKLNTTRITYPLRCESSDIQKVYFHRLHHKLPNKAAELGVRFAFIFEFFTFCSTSFFWICPSFCFPRFTEEGRAHYMTRGVVLKWILLLSFKDNFIDILHIGLLSSAAGLMTENTGHSDIRGWRPTAFYNVGVLYKYITISAIIAAWLRQFCLAWFSDKTQSKLGELEAELRIFTNPVDPNDRSLLMRADNPERPQRKDNCWDYFLKSMDLLNDVPLTSKSPDDWRWQRIFGQGAVILLTGTLLACVEDNTGTSLDALASLVLATVVVACSWSVGVTAVTLFTCIFYVLGRLFTFIFHQLEQIQLPWSSMRRFFGLLCCGRGFERLTSQA